MNDWKSALVRSSAKVREVIQVIDKNAMQIALVVDDKQRLLGTVTDGDVRRGILKGVTLEDPVQRIMRSEPVTARSEDSQKKRLAILRKKEIKQLPVLDDAGRVVGLELLDDLVDAPARDNWVVLMAGGLGSRLQPLTDKTPKPLLPVGKKPILETIIENFVDAGFNRFYISVNYKNEMIRSHFGDGSGWGSEIRYISESERLGTAGALGLLPEKPAKPFFVMNADLLTKVNFMHLLNFHHENKVDATMCVREYDFQVPYGVVRIDGHTVKGIDEKPVQSFFVNAGIYVLDPEALKHIPVNKPLDMPQLFEKIIRDGHKTAAFPIREYWIDIGRLNDFERANGEFSEVFE